MTGNKGSTIRIAILGSSNGHMRVGDFEKGSVS